MMPTLSSLAVRQFAARSLATLVLTASAALPALAQEAPTSGPTSTVVYASGNDLVVKAADGKLLNYSVPAGTKFTAGDKTMTIADLKPGTRLTKPVSTGFDPKVVASVTVVKGKVFAVTPPESVTLSLAEGTKELVVPTGTTFVVDGKSLTVAELKPAMMVQATIVTTAADVASAPATAPATPQLAGALLVSITPGGDGDLPAAGTNLPLYGTAGLVCLALGGLLLTFRRPAAQQV